MMFKQSTVFMYILCIKVSRVQDRGIVKGKILSGFPLRRSVRELFVR